MTNEERRNALNEARAKALANAKAAQRVNDHWSRWGSQAPAAIERLTRMARMWASVAEAMKDGDPVHDAPDGHPVDPALSTEYGVITR